MRFHALDLNLSQGPTDTVAMRIDKIPVGVWMWNVAWIVINSAIELAFPSRSMLWANIHVNDPDVFFAWSTNAGFKEPYVARDARILKEFRVRFRHSVLGITAAGFREPQRLSIFWQTESWVQLKIAKINCREPTWRRREAKKGKNVSGIQTLGESLKAWANRIVNSSSSRLVKESSANN